MYYSDMYRYFRYAIHNGLVRNESMLISIIIKQYHVIEKGLTMPEARLGFGRSKILELVSNLLLYKEKYSKEPLQWKHALGVILEYEKFHNKNDFSLDSELLNKINELKKIVKVCTASSQIIISKEEYFRSLNETFEKFSWSRKSVRNYSDQELPIEQILKAVDLTRNTPSACNRQPCKVYVYVDKDKIEKILDLQGGSRGFSHKVNKLCVITSDLSGYEKLAERGQASVDGGMFAMNLLYALHFYKISACLLNCAHTTNKDKSMRRLCGIKENEIFVAMVSCGLAPETVAITMSVRNDLTNYIEIVHN